MRFNFFKNFKFFPGPERKPLAAIAAGLMAVFAVLALHSAEDTFFYYEYTNTPEYKAVLVNSLVPANMPVFAEFSVLHPVLSSAFFCLFCVNFFILSYGVWRGRSWGRISSVYMFYLLAAVFLLLLIMPGIIVPQPLSGNVSEEMQDFNSFANIMTSVFRIISALFIFLFVFCARYFERLSVYPKDNFYMPKEQ